MKTLGLENKKILVTGSEGFLGKHIVEALKEEQSIPITADLKDAEFYLDLSSESSVSNLFFDVAEKYGDIQGIINNAAVSFKGNDAHTTRENFDKTMSINISGTNDCIYQFSKNLKNASIVNVASIYGCLSPDFRIYAGDKKEYNSVAYGSSKAGIIQLTKYHAALLADKNVRVNCVSPGGIYNNQSEEFVSLYSDRVPMKRMADPVEVVNTILFLLSPLSSYITGENIKVDGGLSIW